MAARSKPSCVLYISFKIMMSYGYSLLLKLSHVSIVLCFLVI